MERVKKFWVFIRLARILDAREKSLNLKVDFVSGHRLS